MMEDRRELLRKIPKIDEVLQDERLFFFTESTPRAVIVDSVREVIDELRKGRFRILPPLPSQYHNTGFLRTGWPRAPFRRIPPLHSWSVPAMCKSGTESS